MEVDGASAGVVDGTGTGAGLALFTLGFGGGPAFKNRLLKNGLHNCRFVEGLTPAGVSYLALAEVLTGLDLLLTGRPIESD